MKVYEDFKKHEHNFNVAFLTIVAIISSLVIGGILLPFGIMETHYIWAVAAVALIIFPIATFLTADGVTEFRTAFYKKWQDSFKGSVDQKKIIQSFVRKYKIKDYKIKPEEIEADGRWNFCADTNYMRTIVSQRNLLLADLDKEFSDEMTSLEKRIITLEKEHTDRSTELKAVVELKENTEALEKLSKIAAEKYYYREQLEEKIGEKLNADNRVHEALRQCNIAKKNRENLQEIYNITVSQINKIYNERYVKYTEKAIKKLNRIHGLKYKIADLSDLEKGV